MFTNIYYLKITIINKIFKKYIRKRNGWHKKTKKNHLRQKNYLGNLAEFLYDLPFALQV